MLIDIKSVLKHVTQALLSFFDKRLFIFWSQRSK